MSVNTKANYVAWSVFAVLLIFVASLAWAATRAASYDLMIERTVYVDTGNGHGSGVVIGERTVLTAAHVVRDNKRPIAVRTYDGRTIKAKVLWAGLDKSDFAVLVLDEPLAIEPARISCERPSVGDELYAVGNPLSGDFLVSHITVASNAGWNSDWADTIVVSGALGPGMSGGPAFDSRGVVVGLNQLMFIAPFGFNSALATGFQGIYSTHAICEALPRR